MKTAIHYNLSDPFGAGGLYDMGVAFRNELFDYYEVIFTVRDPRLKYLFLFYADGGRVYKLDGTGLRIGENSFDDISECFAFSYAYPPAPMPEWARGCVGYQIFPDRFQPRGRARRRAGTVDVPTRTVAVPLRRQSERYPRRPAVSK